MTIGGGGVKNSQKECYVIFEWPLTTLATRGVMIGRLPPLPLVARKRIVLFCFYLFLFFDFANFQLLLSGWSWLLPERQDL